MLKKILILCIPGLLILSVLFFIDWEGEKIEYKPVDWFYQQRAYPIGKINQEAYRAAVKQSQLLRKNSKNNLGEWQFAGPVNIGGRLTDVEINPENENEIWLGAASGGVFKSTNAGETFFPVFDNESSLSIGDIAFAESNTNVIYVGTGEANPGGGSLAYDGNGMYKSMDGGSNWSHLGLENIGSVGRVVVDPKDENIAYIAAMGYLFENNNDRGVYKTINGGDTWDKILYLNDSTGAIDLAMHPQNTDTIYAVMWERVRRLAYYTYGGASCGIYRSYDGGENWNELISGLPTGTNVGRIGIGISESNPQILYAIYADKTGYFYGIYKSENGGDSWVQTNDGSLSDMYSSYGWWFGRLKIDPQNPDIVYAIGFDLYKTSNGGASWQYVTGSAHVDQHEIAVSSSNSNLVYLVNDGGFYISENGGNSWNHNTTLPVTQFYTAEIDASAPYSLYGGTQDNGTNRTLNGNPDSWSQIYGGDGFYCIVDYSDPRYVYAEYQYGNFFRSTNYGSSFNYATYGINSNDRKNWNTPVVINPVNPSSLYYGSNKVYKSINRAVNWSLISGDLTNGPGGGNQNYGTITTLAVSPADTNIIYVGTDDANVWITMDNGENWSLISEELPQRWISRVAADPELSNVAYVTLSGFRENEYMPHVFKTEDFGLSWIDISEGLPEAPVNDLIVWPDVQKRLIAATDVGVFYKDVGYEGWYQLADGLPLVPVTDLALDYPSGTIAAATFGRSMYYITLTVGEEEYQKQVNQITAYPNPASSFLQFKGLSASKNYDLFLFDRKGSIVFQLNHLSSVSKINVQNLKSGIYLYRIQSDNQMFSGKLMIN